MIIDPPNYDGDQLKEAVFTALNNCHRNYFFAECYEWGSERTAQDILDLSGDAYFHDNNITVEQIGPYINLWRLLYPRGR